MTPGSSHPIPLPPDVEGHLRQQPPAVAEALRTVWDQAKRPSAPAPDAARIAALWQALDAATCTSPAPPAEVDLLVAEHPDAAGLRTAWQRAVQPESPAPDPSRIAAVWQTLKAATTKAPVPVQRGDRPAQRRTASRRRRAPLWSGVLATALAVAVALAVFWPQPAAPVTFQAVAGETSTVTLPDGSTVTLNAASSLTFAEANGERRALLTGEAFFDVAHDADRPFVVQTFNAEVTVLGTQFNTRAWPSEAKAATQVAVQEGRVELANPGTEEAVILTEGLASYLADDDARPAPAESTSLLLAPAWRTGGIAFRARPYGDIFAELERRFAIQITADAAVEARQRSIYKQEVVAPRDVLNDLTAGTTLNYRVTSRGFEVYDAAAE
ncbi:MAG: FecR domain-containing protein [Bacteroidota bacterium]